MVHRWTFGRRRRVGGFTLIELLVVMSIIVVLFSAIFVASSSVLSRSRSKSTLSVLHVVSDALEEFKREQQANPGIVKASQSTPNGTYRYRDRYGDYPPDELEVFTGNGLPGWPLPPGGNRSLAPGGAVIASNGVSDVGDPSKWKAMRFFDKSDPQENVLEHRDVAAMVLAIELHGDSSKAILDKIPDRNWRNAPVSSTDDSPLIWLDRPLRPGAEPNSAWGPEDLAIRYIVDDWGTPLSYFAQRDWSIKEAAAITPTRASSNHMFWRQVSSTFIRLNGGQPVIMSYGPDGKDQMTQPAMTELPSGQANEEQALATLVGDYAAYPDSTPDHTINHPLNDDNVYLNADLREKLSAGAAPAGN